MIVNNNSITAVTRSFNARDDNKYYYDSSGEHVKVARDMAEELGGLGV